MIIRIILAFIISLAIQHYSSAQNDALEKAKEIDKKNKEEKYARKRAKKRKEIVDFSDTTDIYNPIDADPITVDLYKESFDTVEIKKKKRKKKTFYDKKTKKRFIRKGYGERATYEIFYVLKVYEDPNPYIRDIYWYNKQKGKIVKSTPRKIKKDIAFILHGPYKKMLGEKIIEEGIFYVGTKHGRWLKHSRKDILVDKRKYYKGWPKESKMTFYDIEETKLQEITPVEYGKKEGNYYYFFEDGRVAVTGEYRSDEKIGVWKEYYEGGKRRKREIQYREDPFDDKFTPYISKEWGKKGKIIYDKKIESRRVSK